MYRPSNAKLESNCVKLIGSDLAIKNCALPIYPSLYILPKIQLRRIIDLSGERIGLILEGSCAEDAINADSARVNSLIDLEKYLFAAASTP